MHNYTILTLVYSCGGDRQVQATKPSSLGPSLASWTSGNAMLCENSELRVRVTEALREGEHIVIKFLREQDISKLSCIQAELNNGSLGEPVSCVPGLVCAAPCPFDGWYVRAVVVDAMKNKDRAARVRCLDTGFEGVVEKSSLRMLDKHLMESPPLASSGMIVNTARREVDRQVQEITMLASSETPIRVLRFNQERGRYDVFLFRSRNEFRVERLLARGLTDFENWLL